MLQWRLEGSKTEETNSDTEANLEEGEDVVNIRDISAAYEDLER